MATQELISQEQLEAGIRQTIADHQNIVVTDDPGYIAAQEALKVIKGKQKQVAEWFRPLVKKAHEAHKELKTRENSCINPLKEIYNNIARTCSGYQMKKEEEARKEREAEEARLRKEAEDKKLAEAAELEKQGKAEEAETILEEPVNVPPPPLQTTPKVEGMSSRSVWKFEITDPKAVPREWCIPDEKGIGAFVRAMKDRAKIDGVRIWEEKTQIVR